MNINYFMALASLLMLGASAQQYFWKGDWKLAILYFTWFIGNGVLSFLEAK